MIPLPLLLVAAAGAGLYFLMKPKPAAPVPSPSGGTPVVPLPTPPSGTAVIPVVNPSGGGTGVLPVPPPQGQDFRTMSINEFSAAANDPLAKALTDDTPQVVDLMSGAHYYLIVTAQPLAPALNWLAVPATVVETVPSATMRVDVQVPGGPPVGTEFEINATDAFLEPDALATPGFLANHGQGGYIPGVVYT